MKKMKTLISLLLASGFLLTVPQANATQKWQDISAASSIFNNDNAPEVCNKALADWRKKNCSSKTCTARWNGQWRNTTSFFGSIYALCGSHMLERSSWREQPLSTRPLTREESMVTCQYEGRKVTNGWQYDDVCRDRLDMTTSHLNHVTVIDSITDANTQEIIKGLKGEASSKKLADGRYIFVLRKYANDPDKLGLVLRRYDRNVIQPDGQLCKNDKYAFADNMKKTVRYGNPGHVRHSQLNGGWHPVYSAGELWVQNGQIVTVSNESGHFKPTKASLDAVKETLDYLSIPTAKIHFYDFQKDKNALDVYKKQCAGAKVQGWDECL